MRGQDLRKLATLAELLYQRDLQALGRISAEEAQLRGRLDQLERQARQAVTDAADLSALRSLGAETLWQDWALRRRAELNSELARIRLRREHAVARLRLSFGKREALASLQRQADARARAAARAAEADGPVGLRNRRDPFGSDVLARDLGDEDIGDRSREH
jgi:hypothetical protein